MARTTPDLVKATLLQDYDLKRSPDLTIFINAASLFVTRVGTCAANKGMPLTTDELQMLETLIAAHNYCCSDQPYTSKSTSSASGSFQGKTDKKLEGTKYGQLALDLDVSGCTTAYDKRQVAGGFWGGTCPAPPYGVFE